MSTSKTVTTKLQSQESLGAYKAKTFDKSSDKSSLRLSQAYIPNEDLPELLMSVAHQMYFNSQQTIHMALTGGAITALIRREPHKIRDYDCLAIANSVGIIKDNLVKDLIYSQKKDQYFIGGDWATIKLREASVPLVVIKRGSCEIEVGAVRPIPKKMPDEIFNDEMTNHLSFDNAMYIILTEPSSVQGRLVKGLKGGLAAVEAGLIKIVVPSEHNGMTPMHGENPIGERLIEDPVCFVRLAKLKLNYPDWVPDLDLAHQLAYYSNPRKRPPKLLDKVAANYKQISTAIEALFKWFSVDHVLKGLLDESIHALTILTGIDEASLKACQAIWADYIGQAEDSYNQKFRLYQCLLTVSCILKPEQTAQECEQNLFYDIKPGDKKVMNYISYYFKGAHLGEFLFTSQVYELIINTKQSLQASINKTNVFSQQQTHVSCSTDSQAELANDTPCPTGYNR